jgi:hypothetical protein
LQPTDGADARLLVGRRAMDTKKTLRRLEKVIRMLEAGETLH